ncbi:MazG-like family protein [Paenibacillus chitinolyticus]|uniref:MazG-like family protein n=1 Tax=Paenibacillus chitinolyticus TaxID=79263 RepID=UPI00386F0D86
MSNREREVDLAKRVKVIEWLKTEVVDQVAHLLKGIWEGNQAKIIDGLASLISSAYILGRRLGVSFRSLDEAIMDKMKKHREEGHQLEDWYGDISALEDHLRKR